MESGPESTRAGPFEYSDGSFYKVKKLDRNFKDTWHAGIAYTRQLGNDDFYSLGFSYDSSPVRDDDRTFDLPVDEIFKLSGGYFRERDEKLSLSLGGILYLPGGAPIDQTSQGVRTKGGLLQQCHPSSRRHAALGVLIIAFPVSVAAVSRVS